MIIFEFMKFENIDKLKQLIDNSNNIVIIPHTNPDGDAVGSCLALHCIFKKLKKTSIVLSPNTAPDFYSWTPSFEQIVYFEDNPKIGEKIINECDLIFTLDFNDLNRIGDLGNIITKASSNIVMIDHHQNPKNYADLIFSHPDIGSTCELLYEIFMSLNYKKLIDKDISTCLYLGIMTDTGSFQYSSVSSRTHEIVSDLLKNKINNSKIYNKVYNDSSKSRLNILGSALNNLTHLKSYATAFMYINRVDLERFDYKKGDSEGIVNYGLSLKDVIFCAIFIEDINDDDNVKISFRSIGDFPCNRFAEENFNGGGHINASGGRFEGSAKKAIEHFLKVIPNYKNKLL